MTDVSAFLMIFMRYSRVCTELFSPLCKGLCMGMIANAVTPEDCMGMLAKYGFLTVEAPNEHNRDRMQYLSYNHSKANRLLY